MWRPKKIPVVSVKNCKIQRLVTAALVIGTNFHFWDKVERKVQPLGITLHFSELREALLDTSAVELEIQRQAEGSQRAVLRESQILYRHSDSDFKKREDIFQCRYSACLRCLLWVCKRLCVREATIRLGAHGHHHWQCQQGPRARQEWTGSCIPSHLPAVWWQILF